jgi:hypothetical protein
MISPEKRLELMVRLGKYMISGDENWEDIQLRARDANAWFSIEHIRLAVGNIAREMLDKAKLEEWLKAYKLPASPKKAGIVMAGNIPLVGFHDFLCGFMAGHELYLKLSSKDDVLLRHLIGKLVAWEPQVETTVHIADNLKNCDAYIATGSNNSARYFEQYFAKYPHMIRKNRTSVAVLEGDETEEELIELGKDIFSYYGLGCRNVTQVCVPEGYDLTRIMKAMEFYGDYINHNKYKNNYDYYLAIYMLNQVPYLTNNSLLMVENNIPFSAVSVLHYRYYKDVKELATELEQGNDIQAVVGRGFIPFGTAQVPSLTDYADGADTMAFLCSL